MESLSPRKCTWIVIIAAFLCGGCNLTGFMDSPSNDDQYISAARACLDQGNFQCAMDDYGKVSSANSDISNSEMAITELDEQGATMDAFMDFVADLGEYNTGVAITKLVEKLIPGAGETKRVAIWTAYNSRTSIGDTELQNFVQFAGGLALAAEILAEAGNTDTQQLFQADLVETPSTCISSSGSSSSCGPPTSGFGSNLTSNNAGAPDPTTTSPTNTNPTMQQFLLALGSAGVGLSNLSASGRFNSAATVFTTIAQYEGALSPGVSDQLFRYFLLTENIGE